MALLYQTLEVVLQVAERSSASRLILLAPDEWANGKIKIKHLATREEEEVDVSLFMPDSWQYWADQTVLLTPLQ